MHLVNVRPSGLFSRYSLHQRSRIFWSILAICFVAAPTGGGRAFVVLESERPALRQVLLDRLPVNQNHLWGLLLFLVRPGIFGVDGHSLEIPMIFIRAPRIARLGESVEALATCRGDVVMARQGHTIVASFHPELTNDLSVHQYFVDTI